MTPRQALMWALAVIVIGGAIGAIIPYAITQDFITTIPGLVIAIIGLVFGFIANKIRW